MRVLRVVATVSSLAAVLTLASGVVAHATDACVPGTRSDVNGDGHGDAVIAEPGYHTGAGAVHVIYGSSAGTLSTSSPRTDQLFTQNSVHVPGVEARNNFFGHSLATADFDGDGCTDVAVGAFGESNYRGSVTLLFGSPAGLTGLGSRRFVPGEDGLKPVVGRATFGYDVVAGDFDGDGLQDLVVGADSDGVSAGGKPKGSVYFVANGPSGLGSGAKVKLSANSTGVPDTAEAGDLFGSELAAGDFNGDAVADLAIGVPGENSAAGAVVVLPGKSGSPLGAIAGEAFDQKTSGVAGAPAADDSFGARLAAGDITNDGRDELLVGANRDNGGRGSVTMLKGTATGLTGAGSQVWTKDSAGVEGPSSTTQYFGYSLAVGQFDGDAKVDVVIGSMDSFTGAPSAGAVTFLRGATGGLTTYGEGGRLITQLTVSKQSWSEVRFGSSLAALPSQGRRDGLLIGVPGWWEGEDMPRSGLVWEMPGGSDLFSGKQPAGRWTTARAHVEGTIGLGHAFGATLG